MNDTICILEQALEFCKDFKAEWCWKKKGDKQEQDDYSSLNYFASILEDHIRDLTFRENNKKHY